MRGGVGGAEGRGRAGGKQRSTVAALPGYLGRVGWVQRGWMEGVQAEQECDRGGLLARLEIKMNLRGRGGGVEGVWVMLSALYRLIKKTSRATVSIFLFF